ncbi:MAG: nucleotidyltransferase domain-containing protein [Candidatus Pacearchaeota archaeon]
MVVKKKSKAKAKSIKKAKNTRKKSTEKKNISTLNLKTDSEIAMDFATRAYKRFDKLIKSIVLFGSVAKKDTSSGSDIDIVIIIDDASVQWDQELIAWYREELEKIVKSNPYKQDIHINTIKLTTWWEDLMKGDPVVLNIVRSGIPMIDFGGFFEPLKYLLVTGKIKSTPEAIYSLLQRAPQHITRSKVAELNAIEGLFWSMVDSAQAALIAKGVSPSSPENITSDLKIHFVNSGMIKMKYVSWYRDLLVLHKSIDHGKINDLKGAEIDEWQERTEEFLRTMAKLVDGLMNRW